MKVFGIVLACVIFNVSGQLLLKFGASSSDSKLYQNPSDITEWWAIFSTWPVLTGISLWILSTLLWLYVLSGAPLSYAYSLYGLNYVFTPLAAQWFFREPIKPMQIVGIALIALGVGLTVTGRDGL